MHANDVASLEVSIRGIFLNLAFANDLAADTSHAPLPRAGAEMGL